MERSPGDGRRMGRDHDGATRQRDAGRVLRAGDTIAGFPEVDVLHPPHAWTTASPNEGSLVLRIRIAGTAILFTGDAERDAEAAMLARPEALAATVLKVPHHGSRTSSAAPFVAAVAPALAVASLGAENRFGHPAPDVVARPAWGSCEPCGAVTVVLRRRRLHRQHYATSGRRNREAAYIPEATRSGRRASGIRCVFHGALADRGCCRLPCSCSPTRRAISSSRSVRPFSCRILAASGSPPMCDSSSTSALDMRGSIHISPR